MPMVNQIECHPYLQQQALRSFCKEKAIAVTAWAPLGRGSVIEDEVIRDIAKKYDKTPAQIILKWHLQQDTIVIPKSVTPSRIKENFYLYDFTLEKEDMARIAQLDRNGRTGVNPEEDNFVDYFKG